MGTDLDLVSLASSEVMGEKSTLESSVPSTSVIIFVCSKLEKWVENFSPHKGPSEVHRERSKNRFMLLVFPSLPLFLHPFPPSLSPLPPQPDSA